MPAIDVVADRLPHEVTRDRERSQAMVRDDLPAPFALRPALCCLIHIEVIAPTGELQPVVAHGLGKRSKLSERQVGPLSGEERDGSWHSCRLSLGAAGAGQPRAYGMAWAKSKQEPLTVAMARLLMPLPGVPRGR